MDPVGLISLVYDVSKDLYTYYQAVKDCDADIKELRTQLLLLQNTSDSLKNALGRDGLRAEETSHVEAAISKCGDAAQELKSLLDKIRLDEVQPQKALARLKSLGRKAVYPFKKSTIAGLAEEVESCQDALHIAVSILQLNVGATTVAQLHELDDKLVALEVSYDAGKAEIVQHLAQCRKMLENEAERKKALAIIESLKYSEMFNRKTEVPEAHDTSLEWLFTNESNKYPQLSDLLEFLKEQSGLFWIQGKPASGKSVFMKYLLIRTHGRDKLWEWSGTQEVIFASHFCWVAGKPMQTSQQGLLQSLLYQVLHADMSLVPIACSPQWTVGAGHNSWHERELWKCLYAAVEASDKRFCFFIDGLDEISPEKDHISLAKAIVKLGSYNNVKVVASSRPWDAFERILEHDGKVLTVERINRFSIINYVRDELDANVRDQSFSLVAWNCIESDSGCVCDQNRQHNNAHELVQTIIDRAEGVFLWVALVTEAVCRHIALRCPISVLSSYVDKLPVGLESYFRVMIFKRIHGSILSEAAMVLKVASLSGMSLSCFALACEYRDPGTSWLADVDFLSTLPCSTHTLQKFEQKVRKTRDFVLGYGRDLLMCGWQPQDVDCGNAVRFYHLHVVSFTHRTIFDFLHTQEMQDLLAEHIPMPFTKESFKTEMGLASCKAALVESQDITQLPSIWIVLRNCLQFPSTRKTSEFAIRVEEAALHQLKTLGGVVKTPTSNPTEPYGFTTLAIALGNYGLFKFMDATMCIGPMLLSSIEDVLHALKFTAFLLSGRDRPFDIEILHRLLQAGLDPNQSVGHGFHGTARSLWHVVLARERISAHISPEPSIDLTIGFLEGQPREFDDSSRDQLRNLFGYKFPKDWHLDPETHKVVKLLVEFGADLTPENVDMLTNLFSPRKEDDDFHWPEFLHIYSQPEKRLELEEDRRNRIRQWPKWFWSRSDRILLGLDPETHESPEDESSTQECPTKASPSDSEED